MTVRNVGNPLLCNSYSWQDDGAGTHESIVQAWLGAGMTLFIVLCTAYLGTIGYIVVAGGVLN